MKKAIGLTLFTVAFIALAVFAALHGWPTRSELLLGPIAPQPCTAEAKVCPDGSAVGRVGPSCEFAACPTPGLPAPANVTLGVGQTGKVENLSITFNKFVQDSRCPVDVQCIQAGAVNINVTFAQGPHVETKNMSSDEASQQFEGYKVSIVDINPPRKSHIEIPFGDYKITFHVSR